MVECVLQGERSLLMQLSMKVTVGVLFLFEFQGPEGSAHSGMEAEPLKNWGQVGESL